MDPSLTALTIAAADLSRLPLCFQKIYHKRTLTAADNESTKLYSQRFDSISQQSELSVKPVSKIATR